MPHPRMDNGDGAAPAASNQPAATLSKGVTSAPPPPHQLWATLESAYSAPAEIPQAPDKERLALYLAIPIAIVVSIVMWVAIVELVLTR